MRCNNIEISLKIPVPVLSADDNGIFYTEECVQKAASKVESVPLINNIGLIIGNCKNFRYKKGYILCDGIVYYGGMNSVCDEILDGVVNKMIIKEVGFDVL